MGKRLMTTPVAILLASWAMGSTAAANEERARLLSGLDEHYNRTSTDIRQAAGAPFHPAKSYKPRGISQTAAWTQTDKAWLVMLCKQKIIPRQRAMDAFQAIERHGRGNEYFLHSQGVDSDIASAVNIGRTRQEPMARLVIRGRLLECIDRLLHAMDVALKVSERHAETIFAGRTHMSQGQPTTYGAYLLSVYDGLDRGLDQFEVAYKHANRNSVGCGALAGTGLPVHRELVSELLGFDGLVEPAYDCEAGQDFAMTSLFAATNVMTLLSRVAVDYTFWTADDVAMMRLRPCWLGVSSMMPQKAHAGSAFEWYRRRCADVSGQMMRGLMGMHNEPLQDVLPIYQAAWSGTPRALEDTEYSLNLFAAMLPDIHPDADRMLQLVRDGYSCAWRVKDELVLASDKDYGLRRAHRVVATFVRMARDRGLKAHETTGELLDEAAQYVNQPAPELSTKRLRQLLDPVDFIERHYHTGDAHPDETRRMIARRREALERARQRQANRRDRVENANDRLDLEIAEIVGSRKTGK